MAALKCHPYLPFHLSLTASTSTLTRLPFVLGGSGGRSCPCRSPPMIMDPHIPVKSGGRVRFSPTRRLAHRASRQPRGVLDNPRVCCYCLGSGFIVGLCVCSLISIDRANRLVNENMSVLTYGGMKSAWYRLSNQHILQKGAPEG